MRVNTVAGLLVAALSLGPPAFAQPSADDEAACEADVAATRAEAAAFPAGDPSRRFAEHALATALTEMSAGEVDECPGLVEQARVILTTRPYVLRPGETLHGYGPDSPR